MPVKVDYNVCNHCGVCVNSCMMDVFRKRDNEVCMVYAEDCQDCFLCVKDCPVNAIKILEKAPIRNNKPL